MQTDHRYLNAELFEIDLDELLTAISGTQVVVSTCSTSPAAEALFPGEQQKYWHLTRLFELEGTQLLSREEGGDEGLRLFTVSPPKATTYFPYGINRDEMAIYVRPTRKLNLAEPTSSGFPLARSILAKAIRDKVAPPLNSTGWTVYDESSDLGKKLSGVKRNPLLEPLRIHQGFSFQFRTFHGKLLAQILPKSVISYTKTIRELIDDGTAKDRIAAQFPYVKVLNHYSFRLLDVTQLHTSDIIDDPPYSGRSFSEFAKVMYPDETRSGKDVILLKVVSTRSRTVEYYPADWVYPSLDFRNLSYIDEGYYSRLTGLLKTQGKLRASAAREWAKKFSELDVLGSKVHIIPVPLRLDYIVSPIDSAGVLNIDSLDVGRIFSPPSMTFKRYGVETDIVVGAGVGGNPYSATPNDLLTHEDLKPLDGPEEIRAIAFVDSSLVNAWNAVKKSLLDGTPDYRGFKETFGTSLEITERVVGDFFGPDFTSLVDSIPEGGYSCAIVVIPRYMQTPEATQGIYTTVKTKIMARGIPVQVIADDSRQGFGRSRSLASRANSPRAVFGIALNILAKVGTVVAALSQDTANHLVQDSMTIGYNITRIVPNQTKGIRTIPLAAPLVIFDSRGAYISQQQVYKLTNEVSLFEEYGDEVLQTIPSEISTLIIHKDGPFVKHELATLQKLSEKYQKEIIPISFRTNGVPRLSNPNYLGTDLGLRSGTFLPLSENEFLMMTTPTPRWNADTQGWPNPIIVTIHGDYEARRKLQLLYHIFALTKMQTGSQRAVRLPISLHFANMIASFLRRVGDPNPIYLKYFVQVKEDGGFLPRWFL